MKKIVRNTDTGKIEISDSRTCIDLDADEEKIIVRLNRTKA